MKVTNTAESRHSQTLTMETPAETAVAQAALLHAAAETLSRFGDNHAIVFSSQMRQALLLAIAERVTRLATGRERFPTGAAGDGAGFVG